MRVHLISILLSKFLQSHSRSLYLWCASFIIDTWWNFNSHWFPFHLNEFNHNVENGALMIFFKGWWTLVFINFVANKKESHKKLWNHQKFILKVKFTRHLPNPRLAISPFLIDWTNVFLLLLKWIYLNRSVDETWRAKIRRRRRRKIINSRPSD